MNSIVPSNNSVSAKQAFPFEQEIIQWDLESAINRCAENFHSFQKSAALLAKDLYIAHEVLAVRGGNRRTEKRHYKGNGSRTGCGAGLFPGGYCGG